MATFFIRKTGSDSNAGTSAGAAWLTFGKALGASGMASGDTVYVGSGVYRENISVAMTSATAETKIIGDVDGAQTGDPGPVIINGHTKGDRSVPGNTTSVAATTKNFLTWQYIGFVTGGTSATITLTTCKNWTFYRCAFFANYLTAVYAIQTTPTVDVAHTLIVDSCIFADGINGVNFLPPTSASADYDLASVIKNCRFGAAISRAIIFSPSGALSFKPGGVTIINNRFSMGGSQIILIQANTSTTFPILLYNNLFTTSGNVNINTLGQCIEDYNIFCAGSTKTNITAGAHTILNIYAPLTEIGQSELWGLTSKTYAMPVVSSPFLGFGAQGGGPSVDSLGVNFVNGNLQFDFSGTATSGAAGTITDSGASFPVNGLIGHVVYLTGGTGAGQTKTINANTLTVLTVDGNWLTNPDNTTTYITYDGSMSSMGKATAGSTTSLTDSGASWGTNMWTGYTLHTDAGTGSGQTLLILSNTATVLTFAAATAPDNTTTYSLYRGAGITAVNPVPGPRVRSFNATKQTSVVDTGTNALRLMGAGYQDLVLPVNATTFSVTVRSRYDSAYSGTLPTMSVLNGTECGVADATATAVGAANTWETLTLSITPTAKGEVTIRLQANSTVAAAQTYFDTLVSPSIDTGQMDYYRRGEVLPFGDTPAAIPIAGNMRGGFING